MWRRERSVSAAQSFLRQNAFRSTTLTTARAAATPCYYYSSRFGYATEQAAEQGESVQSRKERKAEEALRKLLKRKEREALTKEADEEKARQKEEAQFHQNTQVLAARLGLSEDIISKALTHSSWSLDSNQRVEFLGDKVLGLIVGEHLTMHFPKAPVASLAELFNTFASNAHLYKVGKQLGIQDFIRWRPREEESTTGAEEEKKEASGFVKAVADSVEALIGGIYLEKGLRDAREFIFKHVIPTEKPTELLPYLRHYAPKSALATFLERSGEGAPYYRLLQESGRFTHKSVYIVGVFADNRQIGVGTASSISGAERQAAQDALNKVWSEKSYQATRSAFETK